MVVTFSGVEDGGVEVVFSVTAGVQPASAMTTIEIIVTASNILTINRINNFPASCPECRNKAQFISESENTDDDEQQTADNLDNARVPVKIPDQR